MPPKRKFPKVSTDPINFPYISKIKEQKALVNPVIQKMFQQQKLIPIDFDKQRIPDVNMKPLRKYHYQHFSPIPNSWIIDLVFANENKAIYLFILNQNTRFLVVYPVKDKSADEVERALTLFVNDFKTFEYDYPPYYDFNDYPENLILKERIKNDEYLPFYFKGDGEKAFSAVANRWKDKPRIHFYLRDSNNGYQLTNSYNLMDAVVRTIRNLVGNVSQYNPNAFINKDIMTTVIDTYNNTVHSAFKNKFTPTQVQSTPELERAYIKMCEDNLKGAKQRRLYKGLLTYETGNILLVHLPLEKTTYGVQKRRRNFDEIATFVKYQGSNGANVVVDLLHPYPTLHRVVLPAFYTKFLATNLNEFNQKYTKSFIIED